MCGLLVPLGGLLLGGGKRGVQVDACQLFLTGGLQVHHSRRGDAVFLPVADAGHGDIEEARHGSGAAKGLDYLGRMGIHAQLLAQATNKSKPRLLLVLLG